jgi:hypothetical protein
MYVRAGAALLIFLSCSGAALAVQKRPPPQSSPGLFQGTPEEQEACSPDASRYCSEAFPDTFRVLACLQSHRPKLKKACLHVLESHGQ